MFNYLHCLLGGYHIKIKVEYFDQHFHRKIKTFDQQTGQIIQHEIDHCHGVLI